MTIAYIILVALLNLCVGYFTAVHLGFGRKWWSTDSPTRPLPEAADDRANAPAANVSEAHAAEPATEAADASADSAEQPVEVQVEPATAEPSASAAFEALAAASSPDEEESTADEKTNDLDHSEFDEDAQRVVEACVGDFKRELALYRAQLGEIESQVRGGEESGQAEQLQQCVEDLKNANREFLDKQGGILQRLNSQDPEGELADVADRVRRAMTEQAALVKFSNVNIEQVDVENDLETGFQRLLGEAGLLLDNAGQVDRTLQHAQQSFAEVQHEPDEVKQFAAEDKSREEEAKDKQRQDRYEDERHEDERHEDESELTESELTDSELTDSELTDSDLGTEAHRVVKACLDDFRRALGRYLSLLGKIKSLLQERAESGRGEQLQQCVESLVGANSEFLDKQDGISQRLKSQDAEGELADVADRVGRAMAEQETLVKSSHANIEQVDLENNLETGFQRLLEEAGGLSDNAGQVDQTLDDAQQTIAEVRKNRDEAMQLAAVEKAVEEAPVQAGARDRADHSYEEPNDVQQSLKALWKDDPERSRKLTVGAVAVDKATQLGEQLGRESTDRLFVALTSIIEDAVSRRGSVIRHSFHSFVVLFHDSGPRDSTNIVEQIRQTVAAAKFVRRESQIPVTVSCVVASARSDDSVDTLMSRVDATLKESSRYGENRTFLHADEHPSPVVPPQLEIQELTVRL